MKKLLFILFLLLFINGCANAPSINRSCKIVVNITSEVTPVIHASTGEGEYDQTKNQYVLNVDSTTPVDISLSHEDYDTLTLSFTSTELMKGEIVKDVVFNKIKTVSVELYINTEANPEDIQISGVDAVKDGKKIKFTLPSRKDTYQIEISATAFRTISLNITPEDIITGELKKDLFLIRENEVLLTFITENYMNPVTPKSIRKQIEYSGKFKKNSYVFIVEKDDEIFYFDDKILKNIYLHATSDITIDISSQKSYQKYYQVTVPYNYQGSYYYEIDGVRFDLNIQNSFYEKTIVIPYNSKILYVEENNGIFKYSYHKGYDPESKIISLKLEDFEELKEHKFKFRFINFFTNQPLNSIMIDAVEVTADENGLFEFYNYPELEGFVYSMDFLFLAERLEGEMMVIEKHVYPLAEGVIINFVDENNNILDAIPSRTEYEKIGEKTIFKNFLIASNYQLYINDETIISIDDRKITYQNPLFIQMFDYVEIEGKCYYEIKKPIVISSDLHEIYIIINSSNHALIDVYKNDKLCSPQSSKGLNVQGYLLKPGDKTKIDIFAGYNRYTLNHVWTEEMLTKGYLYIDGDTGMEIDLNQISIVLADGLTYREVEFYGYYQTNISEDGRTITLKYATYNPRFIVSLKNENDEIVQRYVYIYENQDTYYID